MKVRVDEFRIALTPTLSHATRERVIIYLVNEHFVELG
jgi:hypothetical protein